jgi:hypothetical protein
MSVIEDPLYEEGPKDGVWRARWALNHGRLI